MSINRPRWPKTIPDEFTYQSIWDCITDAEKDYRNYNNLRIGDTQVMQVNLAGVDPSTVKVKYDPESNSVLVYVGVNLTSKMAVPAHITQPKISATWNQGLLTVSVGGESRKPTPPIDVPITEGTIDTRKFLQE